MKTKTTSFTGEWKVHTPNLIELIFNNKGTEILRVPLNVFQALLKSVAARAIELNDKELNILMVRLTLYEESDPSSKDYIPDLLQRLNSQKGLNHEAEE